jgi:hypothetical protein
LGHYDTLLSPPGPRLSVRTNNQNKLSREVVKPVVVPVLVRIV